MPAQSYPYLNFNRGLISRFGLSRLDIERGKLSAEVMTNWMPRVLGSMMLRPGLKFIGTTGLSGNKCCIPFVFSVSDKAIIELGNQSMRFWINDALLTRPIVTSAVTNGDFSSDASFWTDSDEAGGTSAWVGGGYLGLTGNGVAAAIRDQTVSVPVASTNIEHALRISVYRGPVTIRVGTSSTDDSYIAETELQTGEHSLAFTPTGDFNIRLMSRVNRTVLVSSCNVEGSGVVSLSTPWTSGSTRSVRYDQSGDVVFVACNGLAPQRIERRSTRSWSIVRYLPDDGPFRLQNIGPITMQCGALNGNTTLTSSAAYFKTTHAPSTYSPGALFRVASNGQNVEATVTAQNTFTNAIRVTGVGATRAFTIAITISGTATVTFQRSLESENGPWTDISQNTGSITVPYNDGLDNQITWYRIGVKTGDFGAGTHLVALAYAVGSIVGICRVTGYVSPTQVDVEILTPFGATTASDDWAEGAWSNRRSFPSSVVLHEGRLCFAGKGNLWLSASDAYDSFDDEIEGDSGPISRSIGTGPVDTVNWLVSLERLLCGGQSAEWSVRSNSLDEPLTPTNFQIKATATQGSSSADVAKIDRRAVFVQRGGTRVFELSLATDASATDYGATDLTQLVPEIGEPSIVKIAVQRQPDTRIHCLRSDGTAAILVFDPTENTICWVEVETGSGPDEIVDVCILPGSSVEDDVYYVVNRSVSGKVEQTLEKWAQESECQGGLLNKQADSFVVYDGVPTTTITGLSHLAGMDVVVWADGEDVGTSVSTASSWIQTYEVSGGQITLPTPASKVVVGLPYKARWKSSKLALGAALGVPLTKKKRIHGAGLVLVNTHSQGLLFGRDFTNMDPLPLIRNGAPVDVNEVLDDAEDGAIPFPGDWMTDSRICLEARAPRPCTVSAFVADTELHEQR